jgi:GAF domain-containing protein
VPDATLDERFATNPLVTGEPFVRFYAGAPLIYLRDIRLGALCLLDGRARAPAAFTLGDKVELVNMAEEVASVIVRQALVTRAAAAGL